MRLAVIDRSNLGKSIVEHAYVAALVISNRPRHYQLRIDGNGGHAT